MFLLLEDQLLSFAARCRYSYFSVSEKSRKRLLWCLLQDQLLYFVSSCGCSHFWKKQEKDPSVLPVARKRPLCVACCRRTSTRTWRGRRTTRRWTWWVTTATSLKASTSRIWSHNSRTWRLCTNRPTSSTISSSPSESSEDPTPPLHPPPHHHAVSEPFIFVPSLSLWTLCITSPQLLFVPSFCQLVSLWVQK